MRDDGGAYLATLLWLSRYKCVAGTTAVCQAQNNTVGKGLFYPAGALSLAKLHVMEGGAGVTVSYTNPPSVNNGRNTKVGCCVPPSV